MSETTTIEQELRDFVVSECTAVDTDEMYDDMIDECYSFEKVGGPFSCMCASTVLKECDPVAYRCGKNDWLDGEEYVEIGDEYYQNRDVEKAHEQFISDMGDKITDLESEIEDMESDEDHNLQELAKLKRDLAELQADLATVEKYTF